MQQQNKSALYVYTTAFVVGVAVVGAAIVDFAIVVVNIVIVVSCRIFMQSYNNRVNLHYMPVQQPLL